MRLGKKGVSERATQQGLVSTCDCRGGRSRLANRRHKHTAYTTGGPFRRKSSWALGEGLRLEKMRDFTYQDTQNLNLKALLALPTYLSQPHA